LRANKIKNGVLFLELMGAARVREQPSHTLVQPGDCAVLAGLKQLIKKQREKVRVLLVRSQSLFCSYSQVISLI